MFASSLGCATVNNNFDKCIQQHLSRLKLNNPLIRITKTRLLEETKTNLRLGCQETQEINKPIAIRLKHI
jgi:hypothetical protein